MAWVSVHDSIDGKKLRKLAKALGCSLCEATGLLVFLWQWGLENADIEGEIEDADREDVANVWAGKLSSEINGFNVVNKLIETGWLDEHGGRLYIHDWDQWQDPWYKALEKRKKEAERKRRQRQATSQSEGISAGQSIGQSVGQDTGQSIGQSAHNRNRNITGTYIPEEEPETDSVVPPESPQGEKQHPIPFEKIMQLFNEICVSFPKVMQIDGQRRKAVSARWKTYKEIEVFETLFRKTEASSFLKGQNDRNWTADFDWIMKPTNMTKVLEGKYEDRGGKNNGTTQHYSKPCTKQTFNFEGFHIAGEDD